MMMKDDKSKLATIIISKMGRKPMEKPEMENSMEEPMDEKKIAAEEIFDALMSKDKEAFCEAMMSLAEMMADKKEDAMEDSYEEED